MKKLAYAAILYGLLCGCGGGNNAGLTDAGGGKGGGKGCTLDTSVYKQVKIYPVLADEPDKNGVPRKVSLLSYCPKRGNQGAQSSCVGWASAYAGRTILQSVATGSDPNQTEFSPAYVYNQIKAGGCDMGSYPRDAMETMKRQGVLTLDKFPYDAGTCNHTPDPKDKQTAANFRIEGYNRLCGDNDFSINLEAVKQNLAQKGPVLIGMMVGESFSALKQKLWKPTSADKRNIASVKAGGSPGDLGGHAMCVIGYDDDAKTVEIMNSWGEKWGEKGICSVKYDDFLTFAREAYGFYPPRGQSPTVKGHAFQVSLGLRENKTKNYFPLRPGNGYTLQTSAKTGTKFKLVVDNQTPCYIYVIGQETDGSSYVLFPYTPKHSAYCGTVGRRLVPKDHSLLLDNIGKQDVFSVILSAVELDIEALNKKISAAPGKDYEKKIFAALGQDVIPPDKIKGSLDKLLNIDVAPATQSVLPLIIKVNK